MAEKEAKKQLILISQNVWSSSMGKKKPTDTKVKGATQFLSAMYRPHISLFSWNEKYATNWWCSENEMLTYLILTKVEKKTQKTLFLRSALGDHDCGRLILQFIVFQKFFTQNRLDM